MKVFTVGLDQKPPGAGGDAGPLPTKMPDAPPPGYQPGPPPPLPVGPEVMPVIVRKSRGYKGVLLVMLAIFLMAVFALTLSEMAYNRQRDENFFRLQWAQLKHRFGYDGMHRGERVFQLRPMTSYEAFRQQQQLDQKPKFEVEELKAPTTTPTTTTTTPAPQALKSGDEPAESNEEPAPMVDEASVRDEFARDARLQFLRSILQRIKQKAEAMGFDGTMQVSVIEVDPQSDLQKQLFGAPQKSLAGGPEDPRSDAFLDGFGELHAPPQPPFANKPTDVVEPEPEAAMSVNGAMDPRGQVFGGGAPMAMPASVMERFFAEQQQQQQQQQQLAQFQQMQLAQQMAQQQHHARPEFADMPPFAAFAPFNPRLMQPQVQEPWAFQQQQQPQEGRWPAPPMPAAVELVMPARAENEAMSAPPTPPVNNAAGGVGAPNNAVEVPGELYGRKLGQMLQELIAARLQNAIMLQQQQQQQQAAGEQPPSALASNTVESSGRVGPANEEQAGAGPTVPATSAATAAAGSFDPWWEQRAAFAQQLQQQQAQAQQAQQAQQFPQTQPQQAQQSAQQSSAFAPQWPGVESAHAPAQQPEVLFEQPLIQIDPPQQTQASANEPQPEGAHPLAFQPPHGFSQQFQESPQQQQFFPVPPQIPQQQFESQQQQQFPIFSSEPAQQSHQQQQWQPLNQPDMPHSEQVPPAWTHQEAVSRPSTTTTERSPLMVDGEVKQEEPKTNAVETLDADAGAPSQLADLPLRELRGQLAAAAAALAHERELQRQLDAEPASFPQQQQQPREQQPSVFEPARTDERLTPDAQPQLETVQPMPVEPLLILRPRPEPLVARQRTADASAETPMGPADGARRIIDPDTPLIMPDQMTPEMKSHSDEPPRMELSESVDFPAVKFPAEPAQADGSSPSQQPGEPKPVGEEPTGQTPALAHPAQPAADVDEDEEARSAGAFAMPTANADQPQHEAQRSLEPIFFQVDEPRPLQSASSMAAAH